jgi:hypothetical protein
MSWWVTFSDGSKGCVEVPADKRPAFPTKEQLQGKADSEIHQMYAAYNASLVAAVGETAVGLKPGLQVRQVQQLPYPANPRLNNESNCPAFCFKPNECAGRSSCPRAIACDD